MDKNEKKVFFSGLVIGAIAGAIVSGISALLLTPYSGKATRRLLRARGDAVKSDAERRVRDAIKDVEHSLGRANESLTEFIEKSNQSVSRAKKPSAVAGRVVEKVLE